MDKINHKSNLVDGYYMYHIVDCRGNHIVEFRNKSPQFHNQSELWAEECPYDFASDDVIEPYPEHEECNSIKKCDGVPQDYLHSLIERSRILDEIERYIDEEIKFVSFTANDEYGRGVKRNCLEIQQIIAGTRKKG